jgi:hypothetical protein
MQDHIRQGDVVAPGERRHVHLETDLAEHPADRERAERRAGQAKEGLRRDQQYARAWAARRAGPQAARSHLYRQTGLEQSAGLQSCAQSMSAPRFRHSDDADGDGQCAALAASRQASAGLAGTLRADRGTPVMRRRLSMSTPIG